MRDEHVHFVDHRYKNPPKSTKDAKKSSSYIKISKDFVARLISHRLFSEFLVINYFLSEKIGE